MSFRRISSQRDKYDSTLSELKVQLADNSVVNVTAVVIPSDELYFIMG